MKTQRKGKSGQFKLKIWKTINGNDLAVVVGDSINKIPNKPNTMIDAYVSSTAVSRITAQHNKPSTLI